jgi:hypothetical protein
MHRTASGIERHAKNSRHDVPVHSRPVQAGLIDLQSQAPFHETPDAVCRHSLRVGPIPHVSMKKMCPDVSASRSDHGATLLHALHHTFSSKPVQRAIGWHQRLQ